MLGILQAFGTCAINQRKALQTQGFIICHPERVADLHDGREPIAQALIGFPEHQ
ncbi:hypothetical protein D3C75_1372940 [compost metagenome]